jgi:pimeloyl-ACP methyl ester carboxylesterase
MLYGTHLVLLHGGAGPSGLVLCRMGQLVALTMLVLGVQVVLPDTPGSVLTRYEWAPGRPEEHDWEMERLMLSASGLQSLVLI